MGTQEILRNQMFPSRTAVSSESDALVPIEDHSAALWKGSWQPSHLLKRPLVVEK